MNPTAFVVSNSDHDEYTPRLLLGPTGMTEGDFNALCASLMTAAVERAVKENRDSETWTWVGHREIADALVEELLNRGMERMSCVEFNLCGPNIIRGGREDSPLTPEQIEIAANHNKWVQARLDAEDASTAPVEPSGKPGGDR